VGVAIAMEPKTHSKTKGFTIVEILAVVSISLMMLTLALYYVNPVKSRKRSQDNKRLSDLQTIDRYINEYVLDNQIYPDEESTLRKSNVLPALSEQLQSVKSGWIPVDFSEYGSMLPVDSLNDTDYFYSYIHNEVGYELNAKLEYNLNLMENDGGNDASLYEMGTNLSLISP